MTSFRLSKNYYCAYTSGVECIKFSFLLLSLIDASEHQRQRAILKRNKRCSQLNLSVKRA